VSSKVAEKLLQAAIASFAESGFHGSTTKDICLRADCTEGSLFRLYGSKEKLFEAAVRAAFDRGRMPNAELARILENDQNFERGIRKAMLEFFDRLTDQYLRLVTFALLERPVLVHEHLLETSFSKVVAHTIEREIYRGNLRDDIKAHTLALALVSGLWHIALASRITAPDFGDKSKEARRATVKNFVEIWFQGVRK
jgi:AcrR family transcriptional regulator